jgi:hypothetical protein
VLSDASLVVDGRLSNQAFLVDDPLNVGSQNDWSTGREIKAWEPLPAFFRLPRTSVQTSPD